MSPPPVSIVVPTFRRPAWLAELLNAALPQLGTAAELIVVDNCPDRSAEATVAPRLGHAGLRYLPEPCPGVVHARNAGVRAARGSHVLFLDDDEIPAPGWLAAFARLAAEGAGAAVGRIVPRFEAPVPEGLAPILDRLFARSCAAAEGADVTGLKVRLGTGNALYARALFGPDPFDPRFNRSGGEDSFFIRALHRRGVRFRWTAAGAVQEIVTAERMQPAYLARRRFTQGRVRCQVIAAEGGALAWPRLALWMGVGLAQTVLHGAEARLARARGADPTLAEIALQGGRGKLFWQNPDAALSYGATP